MQKILVVDDEPKIRSMLSSLLGGDGVEVATAENGEQALERLAQDPPQLMIVDVKMEGMDGLELLRRVKSSHPAIGVFMLTGYDEAEIEQQAGSLGALGVIPKPLSIPDVRQTVKEALGKLPPA